MNAASAVVVRALAIIFVLAVGAFVQDILADDIGDLVARVAFWAAVLVALVWGFADGRISREILPPVVVWVAAAVVVAIAAGLLLRTVANHGSDELSGWLSLAWRPFLITVLLGAGGAAAGWALRDRLPARFQPHELTGR